MQSLYKTWKVHGLMFYQAEEVFFYMQKENPTSEMPEVIELCDEITLWN